MDWKTVRLIGFRLRTYGFKTLSEYYKSELWQKKKEEAKNSGQYPYQCCVCAFRHHLELHHKSYKSLCDERLDHLIWLCRNCHAEIHKLAEKKKWSIGFATKKYRRKQNRCKRRRWRQARNKRKTKSKKHMKGFSRKAANSRDLNASNDNPVTIRAA